MTGIRSCELLWRDSFHVAGEDIYEVSDFAVAARVIEARSLLS